MVTTKIKVLALSLLCINLNYNNIKAECECKDTKNLDEETTRQPATSGPCSSSIFVRPDQGIFVHNITPVSIDTENRNHCNANLCGTVEVHGKMALDPIDGNLLSNNIAPVMSSVNGLISNPVGTTCFHGTVAVHPDIINARLLVNEIAPVRTRRTEVFDPCTQTRARECVQKKGCNATVNIDSALSIKKDHIFGQLPYIELNDSTPVALLKLTFQPSFDYEGSAPGALVKLYANGAAEAVIDYSTDYFSLGSVAELMVFATPGSCYCHTVHDHTISCEQNGNVTISTSVSHEGGYNENESVLYILAQLSNDGASNSLWEGKVFFEILGDQLISWECLPDISDLTLDANTDICATP